jgi:tetratricopeptide (TPR) repeat protein
LLTGGARTALPRQQTLRALIDWSYDLLPENERLLLRRLSVFAGSWTLEAAEYVGAGESITDMDVLDLLSHLVNKSLVVVMEPSDHQETRYRMLETIRQYSREKLMESREGDALHDRHLDYYLQTVQRAKPEFFGAKELHWLVWLEKEWGNLRAAVEWSLDQRADAGLELVNALGYFLEDHFYISDLENWVSQLVPQAVNTVRTVRRAQGLLHWAYCIATVHTDLSPLAAMIQESESIYREFEDQNGLAHCYLTAAGISTAARISSEHEATVTLYDQALELFRETQDKYWIANTLWLLGWSLEASAHTQKISCLEESLSLYQELGYISGIIEASKQLGALELRLGHFQAARRWLDEGYSILQAHATELGNSKTMSYDLGDLAFYEGNYALAQYYYEDCLAWANQKSFHFAVNWAKVRLAYALLRRGQADAAYHLFREALLSFSTSNQSVSVGFISEGIIFTLEGLASLAVAQHEFDKAVRLFAWADAMYDKTGAHRPPIEQNSVERDLTVIHSKLDDLIYNKAYQSGRALTLEQAITDALEEKA